MNSAIIESILKTIKTPILYINTDIIKEKYTKIKTIYPELNILYQIKQNSHFQILRLLYELGSGFDIQSSTELKYLANSNLLDNNISYGNIVKDKQSLKLQNHYNILQYVTDTLEELYKINKYVRNQKIWYRLVVNNKQQVSNMDVKFGQSKDEIKNMLLVSKKLNVIPYGISFHVGSQNYNKNQWLSQLQDIKEIFDFQKQNNIQLQQINIGGGFPVKYNENDNVFDIEDILLDIKKYIQNNFDKNIIVYAEPGRYLVQESGIVISKVLLSQIKNNKNWIYIDQGIYQGLSEILSGIKYPIEKFKGIIPHLNGKEQIYYNIGGPTCDGIDIIDKNVIFNEKIYIDDIILIKNTGQYVYDTNTKFNGIKQINTIVI